MSHRGPQFGLVRLYLALRPEGVWDSQLLTMNTNVPMITCKHKRRGNTAALMISFLFSDIAPLGSTAGGLSVGGEG